MSFEHLMMEYPHIKVVEKVLPKGLYGLYYENIIEINKSKSNYEKHCTLAEELGHYFTTYGDIINLKEVQNLKLELVARTWGYEKIVSLDKLIECYVLGHITVEDICTYLEVVPSYLFKAIEKYNQRYGLSVVHKGYEIFFDPLNIKKVFL